MVAENFDRLLDQKEVAAWLGCSCAWLEQQRFRKTGLPVVRIGRNCRYKSSDVRRFIDQNTCAGI